MGDQVEEEYVCTLDDVTAKKALEELHEDPKQRLGQVAALRSWIKQQPHLKCKTGRRILGHSGYSDTDISERFRRPFMAQRSFV